MKQGLPGASHQSLFYLSTLTLILDVPTWQEFIIKASKLIGLPIYRSHFLDP